MNEYHAKVLKALSCAAAKVGVDVSGVRIANVLIDQTWGSRYGLCFYGASEDVCKRAASFYVAWCEKHEQLNPELAMRGKLHFARWASGVSGWYQKPVEATPDLVESSVGYAVSTFYVPDSD